MQRNTCPKCSGIVYTTGCPSCGHVLEKVDMRVQFNTGRLYVAVGQIIVAELRGNTIYFNDTSRMIDGKTTMPLDGAAIQKAGPMELARTALSCYDNGWYVGSWNDHPLFNSDEDVIDASRLNYR